MSGRRSIVALSLLAVSAGGACSPPKPVVVTPEKPSGALFALLPDPDSEAVGRVTVTAPAGSLELTTARGSTFVAAGQAPTPEAPMDAAEVQRTFGGALGALPPAPRHFVLYFQFDSDALTAESQRLLPEILQAVAQRAVPDVIAVGHTDTSGTTASNYELGLRRATIVRNLLVADGLDASLIEVTSHGEADPLVPTPDETREARNRRVEIEIK